MQKEPRSGARARPSVSNNLLGSSRQLDMHPPAIFLVRAVKALQQTKDK
jgi:hypothetical protein